MIGSTTATCRNAVKLGLLLLALIPGSRPAAVMAADTVRLDTGRVLRGVIEEETARHVVIRVGGGRIRLERDRIRAIERGAPADQARTMAEWQRQHFLEAPFVPDAMEPLAAQVRRLLRERETLAAVVRNVNRLEREAQSLQQATDGLLAGIAAANQRVVESHPERDPAGYNRLVATANQAHSAFQEHQRTIDRNRQALAEQTDQLDAYIRRFDAVWQQHHQHATNPDDRHRVFLDALGQRLAALRQDFQEIAVPVETHGAVSVITVRVNDRADGRFIVDTGAGVVTITAAFAERLGLAPPPPDAPTTTVIMADGRTIEAHPVTLTSMTVAGHTETTVAAVILPEPPGDGIDGLLGMSFLRRYHVSIEGSGRLILRQLDPR